MYDIIGTIGRAAIITGFIATLATIAGYFASFKKRELISVGRGGFHIAAIGVFVASASLLILIIKHQFQFHYVWAYSSRDLPLGLLMSTFYAGQEGSFMLWTLMIGIIGVFLMTYTQKHDYEKEVMPIYSMIISFLLLLIVIKNPFARIEGGIIPPDGKGLNPLLQNFWMQIHPPMLFAGFASMSVPFAFAIAALMKKQYQDWIVRSMPWMLAGAMILGTGIMLGGFWAYETLGWGGWWGWDPVENSSLIPWIVCVALIHTMLTQKRTHGLVMTNFVLAILTFVLVLYSTFLTRSGVLGDASVHSFVDPGRFAFTLLVLFMFAFIDIGQSLLFIRFTKWGRNMWAKNSGLKRLLLLYAIIILPSIPLFAKISGDVVPVFTEAMQGANFIVSAFLAILLGIAHFLNWMSYLWLPALFIKLAMIIYTLTGRLHSEKDFKSFELLSRETFLGIGSAVLLGLTLIVLLGTSLPIFPQSVIDVFNSILGAINNVIGSNFTLGKTVDASFYDSMNLPLAIVIALLNGFAMLLKWKLSDGKDIWKRSRLALALSVLFTIILIIAGVKAPSMIVFAFAAACAFFINLEVGIKILRGNPRFTGAYVAHIGIAFVFLGIIGSGYYNQTQPLELEINKPKDALGYTFTYIGYEPFDNEKKYHFNVKMEKDGKEEALIKPIMFISNYGGQEQVMRNPDMAKYIHKDIYIEPQALVTPESEMNGTDYEFGKGETKKIGEYEVTFVQFDMAGADRDAMMGSGEFKIGALFQVKKYGQGTEELKTYVKLNQGQQIPEPAQTKNGDLVVALTQAKVNQDDLAQSKAEVKISDSKTASTKPAQAETLVVQLSLKPFIGLVWLGVITMALGFFIAVMRRSQEARKLIPDARPVSPSVYKISKAIAAEDVKEKVKEESMVEKV